MSAGDEPAGTAAWRRAKALVIGHYEDALARHGPTAAGMEWKDEASQVLRFAVLSEVRDLAGLSVHEIGSGAGHFADFLRARSIAAEYSGSDVSPKMVAAARRRHPQVSFEVRDVLLEHPAESYDVVIGSGVFNVRKGITDEAWRAYVQQTVRSMFAMCRQAIAFNLMTDHVTFRSELLHYSDPGAMLDFCRGELSRYVTLRHDYPLYEYTVYVYRNAQDPRGSARARPLAF